MGVRDWISVDSGVVIDTAPLTRSMADRIEAEDEPYTRAYWLRRDILAAQRGQRIPPGLYVGGQPEHDDLPPRSPWVDAAFVIVLVILLFLAVHFAGGRVEVH